MAADWQAVRDLFPVTREWAYLNSATFGPVPRSAAGAMMGHFHHRDAAASLDFLDWFTHAGRVREKAARLIGATAEDIAFVPSAGVALSWILHGMDWRPGDRILGLSREFPNNLYAPLMMRRSGVEFVAYEASGGRFDTEDFLSQANDRTRLVLLSEVNYSTGLRAPLTEIGPELRRRGVLFCVDGTQSVGALKIDVREAAIDVLFLHGYKWMLCPTGIGFLYVRPELREQIHPTVYSWRSHRDWRNVDALHDGAPDLPESAARYEGGILNFSGVFAMEAVLDLMLRLGPEAIEQRVRSLAGETAEVLRRQGGSLLRDRLPYYDSPIVVAQFSGADVSRLAVELHAQKIAVAARKGFLRVSPHFFNNRTDIEKLDAALVELLGKSAAD